VTLKIRHAFIEHLQCIRGVHVIALYKLTFTYLLIYRDRYLAAHGESHAETTAEQKTRYIFDSNHSNYFYGQQPSNHVNRKFEWQSAKVTRCFSVVHQGRLTQNNLTLNVKGTCHSFGRRTKDSDRETSGWDGVIVIRPQRGGSVRSIRQ